MAEDDHLHLHRPAAGVLRRRGIQDRPRIIRPRAAAPAQGAAHGLSPTGALLRLHPGTSAHVSYCDFSPQVTEFTKECEIQYGMWNASDHTICGPFVKYGQLFVTLVLLREVDGLISHDGWLICAVNSLHKQIGGEISCRLSCSVSFVFYR